MHRTTLPGPAPASSSSSLALCSVLSWRARHSLRFVVDTAMLLILSCTVSSSPHQTTIIGITGTRRYPLSTVDPLSCAGHLHRFRITLDSTLPRHQTLSDCFPRKSWRLFQFLGLVTVPHGSAPVLGTFSESSQGFHSKTAKVARVFVLFTWTTVTNDPTESSVSLRLPDWLAGSPACLPG